MSIFIKPVFRLLQGISKGQLRLTLPDGSLHTFGKPDPQCISAELHVLRSRFFRRLVLHGEIGFGEAWTDHDIDSPDPTSLIRLLIANRDAFEDFEPSTSFVGRIINSALHRTRKNTHEGSKKNIHAHYDLGNEFYQQFLGNSMMYSCGVFDDPQDLDQAQQNKIHAMIKQADIQPGEHVLEIGCGWGSFAIEAARHCDCKVTGITISQAQYDFAVQAAREAGVEDRVTITLCDYREMQGQFDRIVSIEMIEAVGHDFLADYFDHCARLLKPGGKLAIQAIIIPDARYENYRTGCDWIQKYIFPGGHLPSPGALKTAVDQGGQLTPLGIDEIGLHYARTLELWRDRFFAAWDTIQPLGFDSRFRRMWQYYLSYCEAAFASQHIHVYQMAWVKSG